MPSTDPIRVLVWSERTEPAAVYPDGMNGTIAAALNERDGIVAQTAEINDPEQGLSEAALAATDVLVWWGHGRHRDVTDESVARIVRHVTARGMGFMPLHSSHHSRAFKALMGTSCDLGGWREDGQPAHLYVAEPSHPIAAGIPQYVVIPQDEMYAEWFVIPPPDELVFISSFLGGGEVFRSGCCWQRGAGRIFYFQPGHETYPVYFQPELHTILANGVYWSAGRT